MLQTSGTAQVPLPEDDITTFRLLLNVIHGRTRSVPKRIDLESMVKVAAAVDKYAFTETVEVFTTFWIDSLKSTMPHRYGVDVGKWICICWVFDLTSEFISMTRLILQHSKGPKVYEDFMNYVPMPQALFGKS